MSVIVPTFNRRATLLDCLDAVARQTVGPDDLEVIIADDGSTDGTESALAAATWPFALTYLRQANAGPAAARNRALARATAPLTLIVNDDTILAPGAVAEHLASHRRERGERRMVLGSFDFVPAFARTPLGHVLSTTTHLFQFCVLEPGTLADWNFAYTCNLSLPTRDARQVGFDERFTGPAGEDIDFGLRLQQELGYSVRYHPAAASLHDHVMTVASLGRSSRTRGLGSATFWLKHDPTNGFLREAAYVGRDVERHEARVAAAGERIEAALRGLDPCDTSLPDEFYVDLQHYVGVSYRLGALAHPEAHRFDG